jgi:hypothetical protein
MRRIFNVLLVLCLGALLASPPAGAASLEGAWGLGLSADLNAPVLGLRNWYSQGPKLGIALHRVTGSKRSIELEYHYSKFTGGAIEKTAFTWGVDGNQYSSPKAKADMTFNGVAMNFVFHFPRSGQELSGEGSVPYFVFGAGFYDYRHKVSGLVYPGQKVKPLVKNKELNPIEDTRTAASLSVGGGVQIFVSEKAAIDLRGRYNFIFGQLRPFRDWGLKSTFPFSIIDIGVGLKFYIM